MHDSIPGLHHRPQPWHFPLFKASFVYLLSLFGPSWSRRPKGTPLSRRVLRMSPRVTVVCNLCRDKIAEQSWQIKYNLKQADIIKYYKSHRYKMLSDFRYVVMRFKSIMAWMYGSTIYLFFEQEVQTRKAIPWSVALHFSVSFLDLGASSSVWDNPSTKFIVGNVVGFLLWCYNVVKSGQSHYTKMTL